MGNNGNGQVRLNLGSGSNPLLDYINLDICEGRSIYPLAYEQNSVAEIRASHVLEHFPMRQTLQVLKEWVAVLKPGGWLKIAVPDFKWIAQSYLNRFDAPIAAYLMGGQTHEYDYHKAIFDHDSLKALMAEAGLVDIQNWGPEAGVRDCSALAVSLNLMGQKPERTNVLAVRSEKVRENSQGKQFVAGAWREHGLQEEKAKVVTVMVMSRPRFGSLYAADTLSAIANGLRAPLLSGAGAWWEQGLTRAIQAALEYKDYDDDPADVIVTADYDTIATPQDAIELITLLYQNPQYDALVPMQARRGMFEEVLARTAGPADLTQGIIPITSGHFGLTVFRRSVFEKMKAPWFLNKPDDDGHWGEGRTDADIYFWNKLADSGFKAGLATGVVVGHEDSLVSWPAVKDGKVVKVHQSIFEWLETRRPPEEVK